MCSKFILDGEGNTGILRRIKKMDNQEQETPALTHEHDDDYKLAEDAGVWITAGNISVHIRQDALGVSVNLYPLNDENSAPLDSAHALFADVETEETV
jgi:hypothetical protein